MRDDIQTTHVYTTAQRNSNLGNASGRPVSPEMVCESCSASFNIFNRKVSYLSLPISTDITFCKVFVFDELFQPGSRTCTVYKQRLAFLSVRSESICL